MREEASAKITKKASWRLPDVGPSRCACGWRASYFGYDDEEEITTIQRGLLCTVSADAADLGVTVQATIAAMAAYSHLVSLGYFADDAAAAASPLAGVLAEGPPGRAWVVASPGARR